jgi:hypothetical protein
MSFAEKVKEFNAIAGTPEEFNPRKCALYTGLILEEVAELIESYDSPELNEFWSLLVQHANAFKSGEYDHLTVSMDRESALDASVDIAVVAIGQGISVGADIVGACDEVVENNLSKFPLVDGARTVLKDENGKVRKPPGYKPPELAKFLK